MTLRNKTAVIIIIISLLLISLVNASSRFILVNSFVSLEEEYSQKNSLRALNAVANEKNSLLVNANDYAAWDDTYEFAQDLNDEYVEANITPDTFTNLNIDFFIITGLDGQVITSYGLDRKQMQIKPVPADLLNSISQIQPLKNPGHETEAAEFLIYQDMPILLAYHPILTSALEGPVAGSLILGRYFDTASLSEVTQLDITIGHSSDPILEKNLREAHPSPSADPAIFINTLDDNTVAGYIVLNDVFGNPDIVMQTAMERDIYQYGYDTIIFFIYVVFFGSLLFIITAIFVIDRQVVSRITKLNRAVARLKRSGDLSERIPVLGRDEISSLAQAINEMLTSLESADFQLRHSRDELEDLVEARTAELKRVNLELKHEIEEHELGQKALFEAYNKIQLIINSISSFMVGVDGNGTVTLWNNIASRTFHLSSEEVFGLDFSSLPIEWDWAQIEKSAAACIAQNRAVRMDDMQLGASSETRRVLGITLSPLILQPGGTPGYLLTGADITERRLLEQQAGQTSKLEAIGQLSAGVAHEINTPAQLVGSNLQFLRQQLGIILPWLRTLRGTLGDSREAGRDGVTAAQLDYFSHEAPQAVDEAQQGVARITHIVNAMRYFSHPGSEKKEIANLNQIVQNAVTLSRNEWKHVAELKMDLAEDLPGVECLPIEISQVVLNLIINAVQAIQDAAENNADLQGVICITSREAGDMVELRLTDNGIGIPLDIQNKIFDPFFTTKEIGRGTGQGLSIAYSVIVKKHGGTLDFESEAGNGATFVIRLPRRKE